jgi:hypothetical protein
MSGLPEFALSVAGNHLIIQVYLATTGRTETMRRIQKSVCVSTMAYRHDVAYGSG